MGWPSSFHVLFGLQGLDLKRKLLHKASFPEKGPETHLELRPPFDNPASVFFRILMEYLSGLRYRSPVTVQWQDRDWDQSPDPPPLLASVQNAVSHRVQFTLS